MIKYLIVSILKVVIVTAFVIAIAISIEQEQACNDKNGILVKPLGTMQFGYKCVELRFLDNE